MGIKVKIFTEKGSNIEADFLTMSEKNVVVIEREVDSDTIDS